MSAEFEPSASAASAADVAPAEAAAAGASFEDKRAAQEERVKSTNYRQMKANSTSSVFAQSSLTEPDVDELILRYTCVCDHKLLFVYSFARTAFKPPISHSTDCPSCTVHCWIVSCFLVPRFSSFLVHLIIPLPTFPPRLISAA